MVLYIVEKMGVLCTILELLLDKGVVTDEMSLLPTHRHEGDRL